MALIQKKNVARTPRRPWRGGFRVNLRPKLENCQLFARKTIILAQVLVVKSSLNFLFYPI